MLENAWTSLLSLAITQHLNYTTGCGPLDQNGGSTVKGGCDPDKTKLFFRQHDGHYLNEWRRENCRLGGFNAVIITTDHTYLGSFNAIASSGHPGTYTTKSGMLIVVNID